MDKEIERMAEIVKPLWNMSLSATSESVQNDRYVN